jgi:hypothetical protein
MPLIFFHVAKNIQKYISTIVTLASTTDILAVDNHTLYRALALVVPYNMVAWAHHTPSVVLDHMGHCTDRHDDLSLVHGKRPGEMDTQVYTRHLWAPWVHVH